MWLSSILESSDKSKIVIDFFAAEVGVQAGVLLRIPSGRTSAPGSLVQRGDVPSVVRGDPILDGAEGAAQRLSDVLCGASLLGQDEGLDASPESFLGDGLGEVLELLQGVMVGDEHRGGSRGDLGMASSCPNDTPRDRGCRNFPGSV